MSELAPREQNASRVSDEDIDSAHDLWDEACLAMGKLSDLCRDRRRR